MTDTTNTLIEALRNHKPLPVKQSVGFRLYHDSNGNPLFYSMEDLPGQYISVDKTVYEQGRYDFKIVNGEIVRPQEFSYVKLVPGDQGTPCNPRDVMIVDHSSDTKWNLKKYAD